MIKDNIQNAEKYFNLSERMKLGLKFLMKTDFSKLENGKHEILGTEIYANVQDYFSKPQEEGKFEAHREYIDIQFIIEGTEKIGFGNIENYSETTTYNEEKDIVFLEEKSGINSDFIELKPNEFAIFTPKDAHMPSIAVSSPSFVKKVVVKVKK